MYNLDVKNDIIEKYIEEISLKNKNSLENLYNITKSYVYGFSFSILKNMADAEDVLQDTYINIYQHADKYSSSGKPLAWILTITRNLCLEKIRKNKRIVISDIEDIDSFLSKNNKDFNYDKVLLDTILNDLTDEERQIIVLSSINGFKYREIAKLLDLNISTVLSKYHRAIKKIRSNYKEVQ